MADWRHDYLLILASGAFLGLWWPNKQYQAKFERLALSQTLRILNKLQRYFWQMKIGICRSQ